MDERWVLIDHETGLHVSWYFWLRLLDEVGRSDRYGAPFGLLILDAAHGGGRVSNETMSRVPASVRGTDLAGVVRPGRAGVILTQQDPDSAEAAADRILERLGDAATWTTRLLCYPRDAAEITHLLTMREPERASA